VKTFAVKNEPAPVDVKQEEEDSDDLFWLE
jgi:hypothetical protein